MSTKTIDHIVHLTPPGTLEETVSQFRYLGFNVIAGGTHTDGLTANALVVFKDSVYLELLSFTKPSSSYPPTSPERKKRDSHPWASKELGWIDFAFLGNGATSDTDKLRRVSSIINTRAKENGTDVEYLGEVEGGRERPDGTMLKWVITSPAEHYGRGTLPFFCGDVTPREWRVPTVPSHGTDHPSTAQGIARVRILTSRDYLVSTTDQLTTIIGDEPISASDQTVIWDLETVSHGQKSKIQLMLSLPKTADELSFLDKRRDKEGIYEVAIWVDQDRECSIMTPYGRIVWLPVEK